MDIETMRALLRDSGIVGAGGAGFPAWAKLDPRCEIVILNCAESEPLLTLHQQLLTRNTREILLGLDALARCMNARGLVAVRAAHSQALDAAASCLPSFPNLGLKVLPDIYPSGDEVQVVYACLNRLPPPGGLPIAVGAIVFNVETVYNVYRALQFSAPVTEKYVTVTGALRTPATFRVPLGTPFSALIEAAGGATEPDTALLHGGPMTGRLASPSDVVIKTTNAVIALPQAHPVIARRLTRPSAQLRQARAACCQCRMCTELCPRFLLGYPVRPHAFMRAAWDILSGESAVTEGSPAGRDALLCCQCGLCELFACGQGLSPRALMAAHREQLMAMRDPKNPTLDLPTESSTPLPERPYRGVTDKRLTQRLDLVRYAHPAPLRIQGPRPTELWLPLKMHAGRPATPRVAPGQTVEKGACLAEPEGLGAPIHAPIHGVILAVLPDGIALKGGEGHA